jgi:L-seryl-tRNA(Ser) seleniumtransferase
VQAGLVVGRAEHVERIRRHPLYRALRVDKLAYAAIEATLEAYRRDDLSEIPVMRMLSMPVEEIESRAKRLADRLNGTANLSAELVPGSSVFGIGARRRASVLRSAGYRADRGRTCPCRSADRRRERRRRIDADI